MERTGYVLIRGSNYDDFMSIKGIYLSEKTAIKAAHAYKKALYPGHRWKLFKNACWVNKYGIVICVEPYPLHD